ncbi:VOC family protein [Roseivirga sp. BDSF3-8]|uniref:VOC family protein n=1 Tax=Roseivirga sp. BDSF3-8 TaxID=3241598 RepID=UPI003531817D
MMETAEGNRSDQEYTVPPQTRIGHVHLKVSDLEKALTFYRDILGFEVIMMYGDEAAFLSAGGYHHHIGLNTWRSKDAPPASREGVGLFHAAIVYPERRDLAAALVRIQQAGYPVGGASDHGVSEAIYLRDPDDNGIELYWDRPRESWPYNDKGELEMYTRPLDVQSLLATLN